VSDPLNVVALVAFLATALVVTRLISKVRRQAEAALSSVSHRYLRQKNGNGTFTKTLVNVWLCW
jgi:K+-sensing histidine kinase KdpD